MAVDLHAREFKMCFDKVDSDKWNTVDFCVHAYECEAYAFLCNQDSPRLPSAVRSITSSTTIKGYAFKKISKNLRNSLNLNCGVLITC